MSIVRNTVNHLQSTITALQSSNTALQNENAELRRRLGLNGASAKPRTSQVRARNSAKARETVNSW